MGERGLLPSLAMDRQEPLPARYKQCCRSPNNMKYQQFVNKRSFRDIEEFSEGQFARLGIGGYGLFEASHLTPLSLRPSKRLPFQF